MRDRMLGWASGCAAALVMTFAAAGAQALPIAGDQTQGLLTSAGTLGASGLAIGALGTGVITADNTGLLAGLTARPELLLPITGGDTATTDIFHDGSGLMILNATHSVSLTDLHLNLLTVSVTGTLTAGGSFPSGPFPGVSLFNVFPCIAVLGSCIDGDSSIIVDGLRLDYSSTLGAVLASVFGGSDPSGTQFGVAYPDIRVVPEPTTVLLLGGGLVGLAATARRARR